MARENPGSIPENREPGEPGDPAFTVVSGFSVNVRRPGPDIAPQLFPLASKRLFYRFSTEVPIFDYSPSGKERKGGPMCLEEKDLMNYVLGRDMDRDIRAHIHSCSICRKKLARIEDALLSDALERETHAFRPVSIRPGTGRKRTA